MKCNCKRKSKEKEVTPVMKKTKTMREMLADDDISLDEDADREERDEFGVSSLV